MSHWNPWEEVSKADLVKTLKRVDNIMEQYKSFEVGLKYIVPEKLNDKMKKLIAVVDKGKDYSAYYSEIKEVYEALEALKQVQTINSPEASGRAFGRAFVALSVIMGRLPAPANAYAKPLNVIGVNFAENCRSVFSASRKSGIQRRYAEFYRLAGTVASYRFPVVLKSPF